MKAGSRSWYTREDLKPVTGRGELRQHVAYSRVVTLECSHLVRLTGQRALQPPRRIYCFTCRCARRDREPRGPSPVATGMAVERPGPTELRGGR